MAPEILVYVTPASSRDLREGPGHAQTQTRNGTNMTPEPPDAGLISALLFSGCPEGK